MIDKFVGLGRIPNVYITKINMYDNTDEDYVVDVFLNVRDKMQNGKYTWSGFPLLFNYLKVCFIETKSQSVADGLTNGSISPQLQSIMQYSGPDTKVHTYSISDFTKREKKAQNTNVLEACEFFKKVNFSVKFEASNLSVFAVCYIDTQQLSVDL